MGQVLSECSSSLSLEDVHEEDMQKGPRLMLKVAMTPVEQSLGSILFPFRVGEELGIVDLQQVKALEPMRWRFEQSARERGMAASSAIRADKGRLWQEGSRCNLPRRVYRAHVLSSTGQGGFAECFCLLQVIADKKERRIENVQVDLQDAKDAASHAHRFNMHLARQVGGDGATTLDDQDVPMVKVACPVGCFAVGGSATDVVAPGEAVLLLPYTSNEVRKFVFDGSEEFHDIPQAFFHYTACQTGGSQFVCDIQGCEEDDGGFTIVDPVVMRAPQPGIGDLLGAIAPVPAIGGATPNGPSPERFDQMHPRCGDLCKVFDPQRRSAHQRKHCGLGISCGVGGA